MTSLEILAKAEMLADCDSHRHRQPLARYKAGPTVLPPCPLREHRENGHVSATGTYGLLLAHHGRPLLAKRKGNANDFTSTS